MDGGQEETKRKELGVDDNSDDDAQQFGTESHHGALTIASPPRAPGNSDSAIATPVLTTPLSKPYHRRDSSGLNSGGAAASPMAPVAPRTESRNGQLSEKEQKKNVRLEKDREQKWSQMLDNWELFNKKKPNKVKERCRKGIPEAMRAHAWPKLVGSEKHREDQPGLFAQLLRAPPTKELLETFEYIERDIYRTYPQYPLFATRGGIGQTSLFRVLRAYATYDPYIGYCQGMGFITALLLSYMPEEEAFFMLLTLMRFGPHLLRDLYRPGLPEVPIFHYQLNGMIKIKLPKLHNHFEAQGVDPSMYSTHWFLTVFTYNLPFYLVVRIWDAFLFEGWKVVFRVALALLQSVEGDLLKLRFEEIMRYLSHLAGKINSDKILELAFKMNIKRKQLQALRDEYMASQKAEEKSETDGE